MFGAFFLVNVGPFLALKFVTPCCDFVYQMGWPFTFFEEGGIEGFRRFRAPALWMDVAIGLVASAIWAIAYGGREIILKFGRTSLRNVVREVRASWDDFRRKLH